MTVKGLPTTDEARAALVRDLRRVARVIVGLIALLWLVAIVDGLLFENQLRTWGIVPRTVRGLRGIVFAPFLHGGAAHLLGNTAGLFMLGGLVAAREERDFWVVSALGLLVGGLGTWIVGRPPLHIGASGVIFAYFGYLLSAGLFERRPGAVMLSLTAFVLWGSLLFGVLPVQAGISWEGHLFGFGGGVLAARLLAARRQPR